MIIDRVFFFNQTILIEYHLLSGGRKMRQLQSTFHFLPHLPYTVPTVLLTCFSKTQETDFKDLDIQRSPLNKVVEAEITVFRNPEKRIHVEAP